MTEVANILSGVDVSAPGIGGSRTNPAPTSSSPILGRCNLGTVQLGIVPDTERGRVGSALSSVASSLEQNATLLREDISQGLRTSFNTVRDALVYQATLLDRMHPERWKPCSAADTEKFLKQLEENRSALEKARQGFVGTSRDLGPLTTLFADGAKTVQNVAVGLEFKLKPATEHVRSDAKLYGRVIELEQRLQTFPKILEDKIPTESVSVVDFYRLCDRFRDNQRLIVSPDPLRVDCKALSRIIQEIHNDPDISEPYRREAAQFLGGLFNEARNVEIDIFSRSQRLYPVPQETISLGNRGEVQFSTDRHGQLVVDVTDQQLLQRSSFAFELAQDPKGFQEEVRLLITRCEHLTRLPGPVNSIRNLIGESSAIRRTTLTCLAPNMFGDPVNGVGRYAQRGESPDAHASHESHGGSRELRYTVGGSAYDLREIRLVRTPTGSRSLHLRSLSGEQQLEFDLGVGGLGDDDVNRLFNAINEAFKGFKPFAASPISNDGVWTPGPFVRALLDPQFRKTHGLEFAKLKLLKGAAYQGVPISSATCASDCKLVDCRLIGGAHDIAGAMQLQGVSFESSAKVFLNLKRGTLRSCVFDEVGGFCLESTVVSGCLFRKGAKQIAAYGAWEDNRQPVFEVLGALFPRTPRFLTVEAHASRLGSE